MSMVQNRTAPKTAYHHEKLQIPGLRPNYRPSLADRFTNFASVDVERAPQNRARGTRTDCHALSPRLYDLRHNREVSARFSCIALEFAAAFGAPAGVLRNQAATRKEPARDQVVSRATSRSPSQTQKKARFR
jgi:hypothetical protein